MRKSLKVTVASVATLAILGTVGFFWQRSLVPSTYDMAAMGYEDFGGGASHDHGGGMSVTALTGPTTGKPDVAVTLTARKEKNGRYTVNGQTPGPEIHAVKGQLVQVTLVNANVTDGITLHWHGVDVPDAEDGVAGITQDAVKPGGSFVYRFVVQDAGTYWYHSHQVSDEEVRQGLFGLLVVSGDSVRSDVDSALAVHTFDGRRTINGKAGVSSLAAAPGSVVRARIVNTDDGPLRAWVSGAAAYRIAAVDGREINQPGDVVGKSVVVTAGGRVDVTFTVPPSGVAGVEVGAGAALAVGPSSSSLVDSPPGTVDMLSYGVPAALGFDPGKENRHFEYRVGRRFGFLDGKPGMWWTINGHFFPNVPMFMVSTGDIVTMTISNSSGEVHPMHLHGHHVVVLSRNGVKATGSPWWVDSLNVENGETYEVAFVADNPGIWVDHCHNLKHAADGLMADLAYTGVTTPYRVGGKAGNTPE